MLRQLSYLNILWILLLINGNMATEWIYMENVSPDAQELFSWGSKASEEIVLTFQVYLQVKDAAALEKAVLDISDPSSINYGKHLSKVHWSPRSFPSLPCCAVLMRRGCPSHGPDFCSAYRRKWTA